MSSPSKNGDEVVLKEYDENGNLTDNPPITDYTIKGTISNWEENNFSTINVVINNGILRVELITIPITYSSFNCIICYRWTIGKISIFIIFF